MGPGQRHVHRARDHRLGQRGRPQLLAMQRDEEGWHRLSTKEACIGSRYRFQLPDGLCVPDPASRFQPEDVHGPSEVIDPAAYAWKTPAWRGRPWEECVLYELHVGAFTPEGTLKPLDEETLLGSVAKTGRVVIVQEAPRIAGFGAELAAVIQHGAFDWLDAPIERVGAKFAPLAFAPVMEQFVVPGPDDVLAAIKRTVGK